MVARGGRGRGVGSAPRAFTRVAGGAAAAGARHGCLSLRRPMAGLRTMVAMAAVCTEPTPRRLAPLPCHAVRRAPRHVLLGVALLLDLAVHLVPGLQR